MSDLRKAAEMALEALERCEYGVISNGRLKNSIEALRQALAQPEQVLTARVVVTGEKQKPVAWITGGGQGELWWYQSSKYDEEGNLIGPNPDDVPLYTAPPKREWVGLTVEEKQYLNEVLNLQGRFPVIDAIEAKLKEKNT